MSEPHLSVVIPAYNEEPRIGQTLEEVVAFLKMQPFTWEIIVVDDGSADRTVEIVKKKLSGHPHRILENITNRGKGYSVKRGMLEARGYFLLFTDADLSTPIEEVTCFLEDLQGEVDVVIGSRSVKSSRVEIHQPFYREWMGRFFNAIARLFAFKGIHDSQCGFKGFTREAAGRLFEAQKLNGFSFDAEILYLAQRFGYRIKEMPVIWRNSPQSRVSILRDPAKMVMDLMRIRWIHKGD